MELDPAMVPTPCYVIDTAKLEENGRLLKQVASRVGCKILLALKGFASYPFFPVIKPYIEGAAASSLNEAHLAFEHLGGEIHLYAPAYKEEEFPELMQYCDHVVFNSFNQWRRFREQVERKGASPGIRINPRHSEVKVTKYDPCAPGSRLGVPPEVFLNEDLSGLEGIHFHTLCESGAEALKRTLEAVEERFAPALNAMKWVNFGGGHLITRTDYNRGLLCELLRSFSGRYGVQVYLEPGQAVALDAGVLVAKVLDIVENDGLTAILDTSAAAHMPDVLEMPYRPRVRGAGDPGTTPYTYRLAGCSCLAGDVIGEYAFPEPLKPGDKIIFEDMAHYTIVKNNTFNGVNLPSIAKFDSRTGEFEVLKRFSYTDFKSRLG